MSSSSAKFSSVEVEEVLLDTAKLVFHPEMLPEFLMARRFPTPTSKLMGEIASPEVWAKGMSKAYDSSAALSKFLHECIEASRNSLSPEDCHRALSGFRSKGIPIGAEVTEVLTQTLSFLVKNPASVKWLALVMFGLSRAISTTARREFDSHEWTDFSMFILQADRSFCEGDGKVFSRCMTSGMKKHPEMNQNFVRLLAANTPVAIANMVALNATSPLFHGAAPSKFH